MHKMIVSVCFFLVSLLAVGCGLQEDEAEVGSAPPPACTNCGGSSGSTGNGGSSSGTPAPAPSSSSSSSGNGGSSSGFVPPTSCTNGVLVAPAIFPSDGTVRFANVYISGSPCGETVVYESPAGTSLSGVITNPENGYLAWDARRLAAGTYRVTYRDRECQGEVQRINDAQYGAASMIRCMPPEARAALHCTWWDASSASEVTSSDPGCSIRFTVDASGKKTPAGNMANFNK